MNIEVYTAVYGGFDSIKPQPIPVRVFTEATDPLHYDDPRQAAKAWKVAPPEADVTVWIDGTMTVRADLPRLVLEALGDADAAFVRHPWRDDILDEAEASLRAEKYKHEPLLAQAIAYLEAGHPRHWGLAACGLLIRRNTSAVRRLNEEWWGQMLDWSLQDQISLPPLLRQMGINFKWLPSEVIWGDDPWVTMSGHLGRDVWR